MLRKIHYLLNRKRLDQELADEMEFHREMAAGKDGVPFGNPLRLREEVRDSWGWTWIDDLQQDLKYGLRKLSASPGFTVMAVLMLAVGIGVNVAAFGFFNMVALRPLPVRDAQSLLRFQREAQDSASSAIAYPAFEFYRKNAKTVSGWIGVSRNSLRINDETQASAVQFVNADFFTELGAPMQMGRSFGGAREAGVVVLSYGYWQRRFGGDPSIVGKSILLNQTPATVIGVSSKQFSGLSMEAPAAWLRLEDQPSYVRGSTLLTQNSTGTKGVIAKGAAGIESYGRLVEGGNRAAAAQELQALTAELRKQHPDDFWEQERITSEAGGYGLKVRDEMMPVLILGATLCLLILVAACGNLGGLLMARGVARQREMTIRRDIGAGRGRLVKQLFTESLLLAGMGMVAGLMLAYAAMRVLLRLTEAPEWLEVSADWRVIGFAVVLGFLAAIVFGLSPAIQLAKQKTGRMRGVLLGAQIAASCVLLIVSGLLVRALNHVLEVSPGFEYERVVAIDPDLKTYGYSTAAAASYFQTMKDRLEGTGAMALTVTAPLGRRNVGRAHVEHEGSFLDIYMLRVSPEFFGTMKIPLRLGRLLQKGDDFGAVVSESLARRMWPGEDPIGKPYNLGAKDAAGKAIDHRVVGVVGDARIVSMSDAEAMELYQLSSSEDAPSLALLVRSSGDLNALRTKIAGIARSIDPKVVPEVQFLKTSFDRQVKQVRQSAMAVSVLGLVALLLAAIGVVGQVAFAVSQRTKEIGIRMALGAKPVHILMSVLRQFSWPVVGGLGVGVGAATIVAQLLRKELYGISALDPLAYAGAIAVFAATAVLASMPPARKALAVAPSEALRSE